MTDPVQELAELVQQLAFRHDTPVIRHGQRIGYRIQPPLLELLREAAVPTIASGGRGGAFGSRVSFDPAASGLHTVIATRIRKWAIDAGVPRHWFFATGDPIDWRDAGQLLLAWHQNVRDREPLTWIPTLTGWVTTITELVVDPPRRIVLDAPCPRCGQRWVDIVIDDSDPNYPQTERIDALQVTLRDPATDTETICRSCGARWAGLTGAEVLQDELHTIEHIEHGIGCAGEVQLREFRLFELEVTIPIREAEFA